MLISDELERTLKRAFERAKKNRHEFISPEHLLYALTYDTVAADVLFHCGADVVALRGELDAFLDENMPAFPPCTGPDEDEAPDPQYTLGAQFVLQLAATNVQSEGKSEMDGGNVLAALFRDRESHAVYLLGRQNVTRLDVLRYISHGVSKRGPGRPEEGEGEGEDVEVAGSDIPEDSSEVLARFCVNLNERAAAGKIDPLVGRAAELVRAVHILARRRKNNPVLVGDAGVGSGVSILYGPPGCGKTSYMRSLTVRLIGSFEFYYIPVSAFDLLSTPNFVNFWLGQKTEGRGKRRLAILEDAEELLLPRDEGSRAKVSNLLNIGDGFLGEHLNLHLVATTNAPIRQLDAALLRPGRLMGTREFRRLNRDEASRLAKAKGLPLPDQNDFSLAEIYCGAVSGPVPSAAQQIGFAQ